MAGRQGGVREDGGTHGGKREGETPGGILDHRAPRDRERTRESEREINNLNPEDPGEGRCAKKRDNERARQRERTGVAVSSALGFQPALPFPPPH